MIVIVSPTRAPRFSASRAPIATLPAPGCSVARSPDHDVGLERGRCPRRVLPRTRTASTRPLKVASSGCSISGVARTTPGVSRTSCEHLLPVLEPAAVGLDDGVAVEPDDLVEQLGAEAVHHAHHDDQRGDAEHDRAEADPGDERDERLAPPGSM